MDRDDSSEYNENESRSCDESDEEVHENDNRLQELAARNQLQIELDDMNRQLDQLSVPYVLPGVEFANILTLRVVVIKPDNTFDKDAVKYSFTPMDPYTIQARLRKYHHNVIWIRNVYSAEDEEELYSDVMPPIKTIYYCIFGQMAGARNGKVTNLTRFRSWLGDALRSTKLDKPIYLIKMVNGLVVPWSIEDKPIFRNSSWNITEIYENDTKKYDPFAPK